jgi:hypothetical protein
VEDGLEVNKEKTNYMVESHHQKAWKNHNLMMGTIHPNCIH